jgi:hypothetical protein
LLHVGIRPTELAAAAAAAADDDDDGGSKLH